MAEVERWNSNDAWPASGDGEFVRFEDYEEAATDRDKFLAVVRDLPPYDANLVAVTARRLKPLYELAQELEDGKKEEKWPQEIHLVKDISTGEIGSTWQAISPGGDNVEMFVSISSVRERLEAEADKLERPNESGEDFTAATVRKVKAAGIREAAAAFPQEEEG